MAPRPRKHNPEGLPPRVYRHRAHYRFIPVDPDTRLFPITEYATNNAWTKLQKKLEENGIERFQMKDIRAKHATDLEETGGDATAQLGHSQRGVTTKHYLRKPRIVVPIGGK